jgi:flagellar hook protein FlgE
MIASLFAGISGLNANASAMTVIGDNIANVNTIAFKGNQSTFANVLSTSVAASNESNVGRGVEFWGALPSWNQGSLENTASPTDLAINGQGFFIVNDGNGSPFYTRAGQFHLDKNGDLVNPAGYVIQGYEIDANGNLGLLTDVSIPGERISPPSPTDFFSIDLNLDNGAAVGDTFSPTVTVYDSLGNPIAVNLLFTKLAPGGGPPAIPDRTWRVEASIPASAGTGVTFNGGDAFDLFTFDTDGELQDPAADISITLALTNGAVASQTITWDIVDDAGSPLEDVTGYATPSTVTFQQQNGFPAGILSGISVDEDGVVTAAYSNGELIPVFQVAVADFPSYYGLTKRGDNLYQESLASGQAMEGLAGQGSRGKISPMSIEMSNIDLAQEFVKMITTQRAFQANSRVITASDEILTELINIKR